MKRHKTRCPVLSFSFLFVLFGGWFHSRTVANHVLSEEYSRSVIFKEPVPNKALKGHLIRKEKVTDERSCRVKCYLEPNCVSINVGPPDDGSQVCELNRNTDESPSLSALQKSNHYTYYGLENPCHSNPCKGKGEICQVGFTDKGFRCVCSKSNIEEQCGEVCPDGWTGFQRSCYILVTNKKNWNEANSGCKSDKAQLVKIESSNETDFINSTFLTATGRVDCWIGLTYADNENIWKWSDGSNLSGYTNWGSNRPKNRRGDQDCVRIEMGLSRKDRWHWYDSNCSSLRRYICEKDSVAG